MYSFFNKKSLTNLVYRLSLQVPTDVPKQFMKRLEQELQSVVKDLMTSTKKAEALPNGQIHSNYSVDSPG